MKTERIINTAMNNYITEIKKYQGGLPKNKFYKFTKIIKQNTVIDRIDMTWKPKSYVKRLKGREYINIKTGEVKEYMPKVEGIQMRNRRSLRMIFNNLRQLITANYEGGESEKFLTLTYREQTNDSTKIYKDLDIFNKRLRRAYPTISYVHIVEPHASGNYHVHSLLKRTDGEQLNMTYEDAFRLWEHGYVTVEALNSVDNIGAYFIAYFSNMEIPDEDLLKYSDDIKELPRADGNGVKKVIKGKRLDFYPDYMKIYRSSKNLKKPEIIDEIDKDDYNKIYEANYKLTYVEENDNIVENYLKKEQWKMKRQ
jgi:hypothetical protein